MIDEATEMADFVAVCPSERACTKTGEVQREIQHALSQADLRPRDTRYVVRLVSSPCEPPLELRHLQRCDLRDEDGYAKLLRALRS